MVEKMKLLHITGPKGDIDRVMDVYLSKYEIHFENAIASLSSLSNVRPYVETNIYKDAYARAGELWEYLKDGPQDKAKRLAPDEAQKIIDAAYELTEEIIARQEELKRERLKTQKLMEEIGPFRELDYEFKKILGFRFIAFRFGRVSREYYQKLERYIHETDHVLFYECHSDEHYVWGGYFAPRVYVTEVDAACLSFHFERVYIPDSFEGTPEAAWQEASGRLREYEQEEASLKKQLQDTLTRHRKKLSAAYFSLKSYCENFDVRRLAVCTKPKHGGQGTEEYYILYGWMSEADAGRFEAEYFRVRGYHRGGVDAAHG